MSCFGGCRGCAGEHRPASHTAARPARRISQQSERVVARVGFEFEAAELVDALIQSARRSLQEVDCTKKGYRLGKVQHAGKIIVPDLAEGLFNRPEDCQLRWGHGAAFAFREGLLQYLESFPVAQLDTFHIHIEFGADLGGDIESGKLSCGEDAVAEVLRRMQEVS